MKELQIHGKLLHDIFLTENCHLGKQKNMHRDAQVHHLQEEDHHPLNVLQNPDQDQGPDPHDVDLQGDPHQEDQDLPHTAVDHLQEYIELAPLQGIMAHRLMILQES